MNGQAMPNPVAETLKKKKIPTLAQYWSRRALDKVARLYKPFEETRLERVRQYGKKDEDGKLLIMKKYRRIWQCIFIGIQAGYVGHNYNAGVRITF